MNYQKAQHMRCRNARDYLDSKMEDIGRPVYGVTTGFGSLCNITIPEADLSQLQHNLVSPTHAEQATPSGRKSSS